MEVDLPARIHNFFGNNQSVSEAVARLREVTAYRTSFEAISTLIEGNSEKWASIPTKYQSSFKDSIKNLKTRYGSGTKAIRDFISLFSKSAENGEEKPADVQPQEELTPFSEVHECLSTFAALLGELSVVIAENSNGLESLESEDKKKIIDASETLLTWKYYAFVNVAEIMSLIVQFETKVENNKSKIIEFLFSNIRCQLAQKVFHRISTAHPESFIPHIETICIIVDEIVNEHMSLERWEIHMFFDSVVKLLPALGKGSEEKDKYQVYKILSQIVEGTRMMDSYMLPMWNCLKIGFTEPNPDLQACARDAFISFASHGKLLNTQSRYSKVYFLKLIEILDNHCQDRRTGIVDLEEKKLYQFLDAMHHYCQDLGKDLDRQLPTTMKLLLDEFDPSSMDKVNELIIGTIDSIFEAVNVEFKPYLPSLSEKCTTYLMKIATEHIKVSPMGGLTKAIGNGKFLWFFVGIALKLFAESSDHVLRANFYLFFEAISKKEDIEQNAFLSKIMIPLMLSVRMRESEAGANALVEKEQAIKSLKAIAEGPVTAFALYIQSCFDTVYGQLNHTELVIRQASVEALVQFVISFLQMKKTERSQQAAAKIIPEFIKMLKTETSAAMAISILEAVQKLQNESETIFKEQMKLIDVMFDCVNDVVGVKLPCQMDSDFYENVHLIELALDVFVGLGRAMQPSEFAVYFDSILPVLCEKLENAKQVNSEKAKTFRDLVYRTILESIRLVKSYASTSFDMLFPLLLSGIKAEHQVERINAILGLSELLLHVKEKFDGKSEQISQEFSHVLDNEECAEIVDVACGAIARLIIDNNAVIPVPQFLPKLVQKLVDGLICNQREDTFKCLTALLEKKDEVLTTLVGPIEDIALKLLSEDMSKETREAIEAFWKERRKNSAQNIEEAEAPESNQPEIAQMVQTD